MSDTQSHVEGAECFGPSVQSPPDAIWLVYGDIDQDCEHRELAQGGEVTWCEDAQFASDVKYVRADIANDLRAEVERLRNACAKLNDEISQTLGAALGYPRFCDDKVTFPDATEADGVCVFEHVAETLALEAARKLRELVVELERERMRLAACGVVAMADTPESAAKARNMAPEYRSASCDDVARMVDRLMALRVENEALRAALHQIQGAANADALSVVTARLALGLLPSA